MHKIIELEGRLIAIETKEIEINGNPILTPGKIMVYHPPMAQEHLLPTGKIHSPIHAQWYQTPKPRIKHALRPSEKTMQDSS